MRRQDIGLRRAAREGDAAAQLELAKRYLRGTDGFPKHVPMALEYLEKHSDQNAAMLLLASSLSLTELIALRQEGALFAAVGTSEAVDVKLAVWLCLRQKTESACAVLARRATSSKELLSLCGAASSPLQLSALLARLESFGALEAVPVALAAARRSLEQQDVCLAAFALAAASALDPDATHTLAWELLCDLVWASEDAAVGFQEVPVQQVYDALESAGEDGNTRAWFTLGRALCGLPCGANQARSLVSRQNLRRGVALLLRAADAGHTEAWLHLYRLSANGRCSVANPEMARFCLSKAAAAGFTEAQRRLGALMLRESASLRATEEAVALLYAAATKDDLHADVLLRSLILPVVGSDEEAARALDAVRPREKLFATCLDISRTFGLTRQEACQLDYSKCLRPWGLVTSHGRSLQPRVSAPRAVPAVGAAALEKLRTTARMVEQASGYDSELLRQPALQRQLLAKLGVAEELFFAEARVEARERVRVGTRWAHHESGKLRAALE